MSLLWYSNNNFGDILQMLFLKKSRIMKASTMIFVFLVCGVLGLIGVSATEIRMNETVLGTNSDIGNVAKTIDVAYDGDTNMVYVAGTLTGNIGVVSVPEARIISSWQIGDDEFDVKCSVWDSYHKVLWHVSKGGKKIYASDPRGIYQKPDGGLFAVYNLEGSGDLPVQDPPNYPIQNAIVDPRDYGTPHFCGRLWITTATDTSNSQRKLICYQITRSFNPITSLDEWLIFKLSETMRSNTRDMQWAPNWPCSSGVTGAMVRLCEVQSAGGEKKFFVFIYDVSSGNLVYETHHEIRNPDQNWGLNQIDVDENNNIYVSSRVELIRLEYDFNSNTWSNTYRFNLPYDNAVEEMRVNLGSDRVALLYKRDEHFSDTGNSSSPVLPFSSWLDIYEGSTGTHITTWSSGIESGRMDVITGSAIYDFVVGEGGNAQVALIPHDPNGNKRHVRVGTTAEYLLLPEADKSKILCISRLGGSILTVLPQAPGVGTFQNWSVVGHWPCGMAEDPNGDYLYVLSHFDTMFRVLDMDALLSANGPDPSVLIATEKLRVPGSVKPEFQISDTISAMSSSEDGCLHLVMLNELGDVHFVRTSGSNVNVEGSISLLDVETDLGPGRMQGAVGYNNTAGRYCAFIYESDNNILHCYTELSGSWTETTSLPCTPNQLACSAYATNALYWNSYNNKLYVYDLVYDASNPNNVIFDHYLHKSDLNDPAEDLVVMKVVAARSDSQIFGLYLAQDNEEILYDCLLNPKGTAYGQIYTYNLFFNDTMKSGAAMREDETGAGSWEGAFTQPHLSIVHWYTGLP